MAVDYFSFLNKVSSFPDKDLGSQVADRLGFNMIAYELKIVFLGVEDKI